METSAKSGYNIDEIFQKAAKLLYKEYLKYKSIYNSGDSTSQLDSIDTKNSSKTFNLKISDSKIIKENKESQEMQNNKSRCFC